ncbi:amidohydrolase [Vogesella sp. LIG4]|uniref:amidohydrolase n=1 Tax=Vogesella sp. LIG4 TaxID=1192162 RepID=UPI00081FBF0E|nr:amidohydrolase [Vogesella sp. LIG4]SCK21099.1 hypothetical protein PSELUDRAFT_2370 [Vogesella sp. LIG4]
MTASADTIYLNGAIFVGDRHRSFADAMAIGGGKVLAIGSPSQVMPHRAKHTEVVDLAGKLLLPGFIDGHVHPLEGHQIVGEFDASGLHTADAILARVAECARAQPDEQWVYLGGANLSLFGAYPTRDMLDRIESQRPLLLVGHDVHSGCLNSKGLALAGISAATPDPSGGVIERDATGEPSGVIHEAAFYRVCALIPQLSPVGYPQSLQRAHEMAHRLGITGWFDARVDEPVLKAYSAARKAGTLKTYVSLGLLATPRHDAAAQVARFVDWRGQHQHDNLRVNTVKIFIDGVTESKTAALLQPYEGSNDCGLALWEQDALNEIACLADAAGFDLHFHTLADRAVRMALDALEYVQQQNGKRDRRAQLAHLQLVDPADMPRFAPLGAIASMQALWCAATPALQQLYRELLGDERNARNYPFRSLRNAGAMLAGGSDWCVSTMNPLPIIQTGVSHVPVEHPDNAPWNPDERLDLLTMVEAHTINAAYALRLDDCTGSLEAGKDASFAILDRNIFAGAIQDIHRARVTETFFRGERTFAAASAN